MFGFEWIEGFLRVIFVLVALIMVFLIMLQEGKGGGLAGLGGTKAAGIEGVTNPIRRATGYLAAMFFILAILLGVLRRPEKSVFASSLQQPPSTTEAKSSVTPRAEPKAVTAPAKAEAAAPAALQKEEPKTVTAPAKADAGAPPAQPLGEDRKP